MAEVKYENQFNATIEQDRINIKNNSLTWGEALRMFMYDLPGLAERINYEIEEVENLW